MTTLKPAIFSANIVSVEGSANPPAEEPEPTPESTSKTETATQEKAHEGNEEDKSEIDDSNNKGEVEEGERTSTKSSFGAVGASVVAVAGIGSFAMWLMRRRNKKNNVEKLKYKPLRTED